MKWADHKELKNSSCVVIVIIRGEGGDMSSRKGGGRREYAYDVGTKRDEVNEAIKLKTY